MRTTIWTLTALSIALAPGTTPPTVANDPPELDVFAKKNLVAWCIVPFDAKQRGPGDRANMLQRLGIKRVAYDWRQQHVPTFEEEILEYKKHDLEYFAFWSFNDRWFGWIFSP